MTNDPVETEKLNLFKAVTLVEIARQYLDLVLLNAKIGFNGRKFLTDERRRLHMFIEDINRKMKPESKDIIKNYLNSDLLVYDSVFDKMAIMTEEGRRLVEDYCEQILKERAA